MGWALSCLRLSAYYEDLHLYTDANGCELFIEYLGLPYKTVQTCYDALSPYPAHLWALPKVLTYAAQTTPFIHVDGDVFIWEKFRQDLEEAALVAQNPEKGTGFYQEFIGRLKKDLSWIPDFMTGHLNKSAIPSYNAGILGGSDHEFFEKFAGIAWELIRRNENVVSPNFNVLFEQLLFYSLSEHDKKTVTCQFSETYEDKGYSSAQFGDFSAVPYRLTYLHLIGHLKRDPEICASMSKTLFQEYPEYFFKIISLFKGEHVHYDTKIQPFFTARVPPGDAYALECLGPKRYTGFFFQPSQEQRRKVLARNPHVTIRESSACVPTLFGNGSAELLLDELNYNILAILEEPRTVEALFRCLEACFTDEDAADVYELVLFRLKYLFSHYCIYIANDRHPQDHTSDVEGTAPVLSV